MADPFIAEIMIVSFDFTPQGWAFCNGQLLPISSNTALFSILGTTYGGNGQTTFALPNLQGRAAMQEGRGPGLTLRQLGETGGAATVTLSVSQMPQHTHSANGKTSGGSANPSNMVWGTSGGGKAAANFYAPAGPLVNMHANALTNSGGGLPHNNLMPRLALNYVIALQGIFPQRS